MAAPQQAYSIGATPPPESLRLHLNEYRFNHCPAVLKELSKSTQQPVCSQLTHYQSGVDSALPDRLGDWLGVPPANIIITPGSDDALRAAIDTSTGRGHTTVVMGTPGYTHFEHYCRLKPLQVCQYAIGLNTDHAAHLAALEYHAPAMAAGCLVYLCNPNNPTGDMWSPITVAGLADRYPKSLFLIDEAYIEFCMVADAECFRSSVEVTLEHKNVMVTRTFSKAFGLAALRIGYAVACPELIAQLAVAVSPKAFNPAAGRIALAALAHRDHYFGSAFALRDAARDLIRTLRESKWWVQSTSANFFLVYVGAAAAAVAARMAAAGVVVRSRDELPGMAGFIRVTLGTAEDNACFLRALSSETPPEEPPIQTIYTPKDRVAAIKIIIRETLIVLTAAGVAVWAQGGTMLGVQRHHGMIPTDDDGDLAYLVEGPDQLAGLVREFAERGLTLQRNRTDAYWQVGLNKPGEPISRDHVDVFSYRRRAENGVMVYRLDDERFAYEDPDSPQAHCNTSYFEDELFPLTDGKFYDMTIKMPARADQVLKRALGDDYMQVMRVRSPPVSVVIRDFSPA